MVIDFYKLLDDQIRKWKTQVCVATICGCRFSKLYFFCSCRFLKNHVCLKNHTVSPLKLETTILVHFNMSHLSKFIIFFSLEVSLKTKISHTGIYGKVLQSDMRKKVLILTTKWSSSKKPWELYKFN